jgi:hypothetical protein
MKNKIFKNQLRLTAIVTSATLVLGMAAASAPVQVAQAAVTAQTGRVSLNMSRFNERVAKLGELAGLQAGDRIQLNDDGKVTGSIWQGTYIYYPAGSQVPAQPMYLRWKDGVVAITLHRDDDDKLTGDMDASYVAQYEDNARERQKIKTLKRDESDSSVLRIPGQSWLFRVDGNGKLIALVDAFVFESGSTPIINQRDYNGDLPDADGSQPVPVAAQEPE